MINRKWKFFNRTREGQRWDEAILYAAGYIIESHDNPVIAKDLLDTCGMNGAWLKQYRKDIEPKEKEIFKKAGFFK